MKKKHRSYVVLILFSRHTFLGGRIIISFCIAPAHFMRNCYYYIRLILVGRWSWLIGYALWCCPCNNTKQIQSINSRFIIGFTALYESLYWIELCVISPQLVVHMGNSCVKTWWGLGVVYRIYYWNWCIHLVHGCQIPFYTRQNNILQEWMQFTSYIRKCICTLGVVAGSCFCLARTIHIYQYY
jgi:hypothetical protein